MGGRHVPEGARGVFLDVACALGKDGLKDGYGMTCAAIGSPVNPLAQLAIE